MTILNSNIDVTVQNQELAPVGISGWLGVFPLMSAVLFATQMSAAAAICLAAPLAVTMAAIAHASIKDADNDGRFETKQRVLGLAAPAQFALLMWLAVTAGNAAGSTYLTSSAIAFAAFAVLVAIEFVASAVTLITLEREDGISGLSLASLINGKYSGLFGRLI